MEYKELQNLTDTELATELEKQRSELDSLAMKIKLGQGKNTHKLKEHRKTIARILTLLTIRKAS